MIEEFLDKKINYLITDKQKKEWPTAKPSLNANNSISSSSVNSLPTSVNQSLNDSKSLQAAGAQSVLMVTK